MKLPNHHEITLHNFDTSDTIKNKIAISYDIQPKYLNKFKVPLNLYKEKEWPENIKIIPLQEAFKNFESKYKNNTTFFNFYKYISPNYDLTPQELYNIWLNYIYEITEGDDQLIKILNSDLNESINNLEKLYPHEFSGLDKKKKDIDYKPSTHLKQEIEKFDSEILKFENIDVYNTTEFIQKKQYITVTIQSDKLDYPFEYLFDKIILTENIPLAIYNEYSKIFKSFVLNGNVPNYENSIVLLYKKSQIEYIQEDENDEDDIEEDGVEEIVYKNTSKLMWYRLYNVVVIRKNDVNDIVIEMDIENNVNVDSIVENLKSVLNWDIDFTTLVTTNKISGEFYALHQILDPVITKDVLLFNNVLKNFMYSNDNLLAFDLNLSITKTKFHNIIHYIDPITKNRFVCHVSTRAATKTELLKYSSIKIGEPISVFKIIRGANIDVINHFKVMIGKFITIYNKHVKELTEEYSKYISGVNTKIFVSKKETLTDVMPNIFLEKYSRLCAKQKIPQLISEEAYDEKKPSQLEFPKDDDNSKYFECDSEEYPFAGMVVNKLSNNVEYPFLPCCFKLDQKSNPTSNYNKYFQDKEIEKSGQEYERLLQTQKFAKFGTYGVLPENIKQLLSIIDKNNEYYRRGMHFQNPILGMSSFLECVLDALNWNNILSFGNDEVKREQLVTEERKLIASFIKGNGLCKQECYNLSVNEIELNIADPTHYLSPLLYIRALEEFYNVNIFLFQRDNRNPHGNFILPNHEISSNYIIGPLKSRQTIFIYEHVGGIWDNKYSCELIIRFNPKTLKTMTLFNSTDDIVINLYKQLLQMYPNYQSNQLIHPVEPPDVKNISSQYIDNFGKVRYLIYKNIDAVIYCQPIQPFNVPIEKTLPEIKGVDKFIVKYGLQPHGSDAYITKEGFQIFAKMGKNVGSSNSIIDTFVYNKRTSIHLLEYLLYLFSKYIHENSSTSSKTQVLVDNFLQKHTIINKTGDISYNINFMVESNPKIVEIDSIEMRSRINYMIRVHLLNNRKGIVNYRLQNYLENFYNSILDFKEYPNQEIVCTKILYTIYNNLYDTKLKTLPPINYTTELFFLRHNHINYLAQMTKTLDEALIRLYNWIIKKSNTNEFNQEIPAYPFTCIPYSNMNYGVPVKVTGGNSITKKELFIIYVYDGKINHFIPLFEL